MKFLRCKKEFIKLIKKPFKFNLKSCDLYEYRGRATAMSTANFIYHAPQNTRYANKFIRVFRKTIGETNKTKTYKYTSM